MSLDIKTKFWYNIIVLAKRLEAVGKLVPFGLASESR